MGKPAVVMFVGVEGLSEKDQLQLPPDVRRIFVDGSGEITIEGLVLECITEGRHNSADPGSYIGFGVAFYREYWDSGLADCDPAKISQQAAETLAKVQELFTRWYLTKKPRTFTCCVYIS